MHLNGSPAVWPSLLSRFTSTQRGLHWMSIVPSVDKCASEMASSNFVVMVWSFTLKAYGTTSPISETDSLPSASCSSCRISLRFAADELNGTSIRASASTP